ncbi:hypothetical protein Bca52824_026207 [Brassica carinata]|uniref:Uncharacterized protein n=1 Tax=Brassica carinata TaxID=52824 RepID=A0A8X7SKW6_BRACI|nr:hypothetical protein Bca52824_026207 [Brassica carinata]
MGQQQVYTNTGNVLQPGILGPRPGAQQPNEDHSIVAPSVSQPTLTNIPANLAHAFNTMTLEDPSNATWYFDTGAKNHIAADQGTLRSIVKRASYLLSWLETARTHQSRNWVRESFHLFIVFFIFAMCLFVLPLLKT